MKHRSRLHTSIRAAQALLLALLLAGSLTARAQTSGDQLAPVATQHTVYLPLIAKPGTPPIPPSATSDTLIAAALARGELDAETALLYRVFAAYEDPRLPAKFRGDDRTVVGSGLMREVNARLATLKPATRATLQPFLLPPTAPGSWLEQRSASAQLTADAAPAANKVEWDTVCATSSRIKVWYQRQFPQDATLARSICTEMESTVWPALTGLMGRWPLSDINEANNGANEKFDIYIVERTRSQTRTYAGRLEKTPTYMLINRSQYVRDELARFFMEAILYSYEIADAPSLVDWDFIGTSVWAMDFVYSGNNAEHIFSWDYLVTTEYPLDFTDSTSPRSEITYMHEGKYLWPFYLARIGATPLAIPKTWELGEQQSHLKAVDTAIGGWKQHWPNFSLYNWNHEPVDLYKGNDQLKEYARPEQKWDVKLEGTPALRYSMPAQVKPLATEYYSFTFKDLSARSVLLTNPFANGQFPHASVQLVYRLGPNELGIADITGKQYYSFCRDLEKERVTELMVIVGNSDWQGKKTLEPPQPMTLDATNIGCRGWKVDAKFTDILQGPSWLQTTMLTTTAVFERYMPPNGPFHVEFYQLTSGTAKWSHKGHKGACAGERDDSYDVRIPGVNYTMVTEAYNNIYLPPFGVGSREYTALGVMSRTLPDPIVIYYCAKDEIEIVPNVQIWLQSDLDATMEKSIKNDGVTIEDSINRTYPLSVGSHTIRGTWTMTALPPE